MTIQQLVKWAVKHGYDISATEFSTESIPGDRWGRERGRVWESPNKWDLVYEEDLLDLED